MRKPLAYVLLAALITSGYRGSAAAQIAVSSNDHKTSWSEGIISPVLDPTPDTATIIDLEGVPRVIATLRTGGQAGGVSINRTGTLALVATRIDGSVAVFGIDGKTVTPLGKVVICESDCHPATPGFTPDGRTALVTRYNDHKVAILRVEGTTVEYTGEDISANLKPYPDGDVPDAQSRGGVQCG